MSVLENKIELKNYKRQSTSEKATNYERLLPAVQQRLAQGALKSPYAFDFIKKREDVI